MIDEAFDSEKIEAVGWRQGSVLTEEVARAAREAAPARIVFLESDWPRKREELERRISTFWNQFTSGIICDGVEVLGTDEITLADIEYYQRFDADWLSFSNEDDVPMTPLMADLIT